MRNPTPDIKVRVQWQWSKAICSLYANTSISPDFVCVSQQIAYNLVHVPQSELVLLVAK